MLKPLQNKVSQIDLGNIDPINQNIEFCNWLVAELYKEKVTGQSINQLIESLCESFVKDFCKKDNTQEEIKITKKEKDDFALAINRAFMFFKSIYIDKNSYLKKKYSENDSLKSVIKCLNDNVDKITAAVNDKIFIELDTNKKSFLLSKDAQLISMANSAIHWTMYNFKTKYEQWIQNVYDKFKKSYVPPKTNKSQALAITNDYIERLLSRPNKRNPKTGEITTYQPWMIDLLVKKSKRVANFLATKNAQTEQDLLNEFRKEFTVPLMPLYYAYSRYNTNLWLKNNKNQTKTIETLVQEYYDELAKDPTIENKLLKTEAENINTFKDKYFSLNMTNDRYDAKDLSIGSLEKQTIDNKPYLTLNFPKLNYVNQNLIDAFEPLLSSKYISSELKNIKNVFKTLDKTDPKFKTYKEMVNNEALAKTYVVLDQLRKTHPQEAVFIKNSGVKLPTILEWYFNTKKLLGAKVEKIDMVKNLFGKDCDYTKSDASVQAEKRWVKTKYTFTEGDLLINTNLNDDGSPHFTAPGYRADGVELIPVGKNKEGKLLYHLETLEPADYTDPSKFKKEEILSNVSHIVNLLPKGVSLSQIKSIGITSCTMMSKEENKELNELAGQVLSGPEFISNLENSIAFNGKLYNKKLSDFDIMSFVVNTPIVHHSVNVEEWNKDPNIEHLKNIFGYWNNQKGCNVDWLEKSTDIWKAIPAKPNSIPLRKKYDEYFKKQKSNVKTK